jgi:lipid-A-disaccharide synthase
MPRVFISVAEDSADVHAAALIRAAARLLPDVRFYGLVGPRCRAAGAQMLADLTPHAAMLAGTLGVVRRALRIVKQVEADWDRDPPAAVVLLDSPELHLGVYELGLPGLAARARRRGIPVLYYIAPQTWASRPWRDRWIARDVTRLACILPFEVAHFHARGIAAEFVGHPLFETLRHTHPDPAAVARLRAAGTPLVALLPGSRRHVIETTLPYQLEVLGELDRFGLQPAVAVSAVSDARRPLIASILAAYRRTAPIVVADNAMLLAAADLVLVASGTVTLEVAHHRKPMIVMYDIGRVLNALHNLTLRRTVRLPHLSLVNILAAARVVPEFMPDPPDPALIARVAQQLLADDPWRRLMIRQLDETIRPLEQSPASENVCRILGELLGAAAPGAPRPTPGSLPYRR